MLQIVKRPPAAELGHVLDAGPERPQRSSSVDRQTGDRVTLPVVSQASGRDARLSETDFLRTLPDLVRNAELQPLGQRGAKLHSIMLLLLRRSHGEAPVRHPRLSAAIVNTLLRRRSFSDVEASLALKTMQAFKTQRLALRRSEIEQLHELSLGAIADRSIRVQARAALTAALVDLSQKVRRPQPASARRLVSAMHETSSASELDANSRALLVARALLFEPRHQTATEAEEFHRQAIALVADPSLDNDMRTRLIRHAVEAHTLGHSTFTDQQLVALGNAFDAYPADHADESLNQMKAVAQATIAKLVGLT